MTEYVVRIAEAGDGPAWAAMRAKLWPDADACELESEALAFLAGGAVPALGVVFIAAGVVPVGFLELAVRPYANGCDSTPVPFVEGWYVEPAVRGCRVGAALLGACEAWCRSNGYTELGSDALIGNEPALQAHLHSGFVETERTVALRKRLA